MCKANDSSNSDYQQSITEVSSEKQLAIMLKEDLGVVIDSQALRMFIRMRWDRVSRLSHRIHEGKS